MRTDRGGAPLASVDATDAAGAAEAEVAEVDDGRAQGGRREAFTVLTVREALLEAAEHNRRAIAAAGAFDSVADDQPMAELWRGYHRDRAVMHATVARGLAAYAEAQRWAP